MEENEKSDQKPSKRELKNYAKYSGIAFKMLSIILIGVFGGVMLDGYLELKQPIFTIIFSLCSVSLSIYVIIKEFS